MIPTAKRSHTAILLNYKNESILIDCGEGTQRQFKIAKLSPSRLTRILLTHWHGDHVLGLPGLLETLHQSDCQRTLQIYGPRKIKDRVNQMKSLFNINTKTETTEVSNRVFETKEFIIEAEPMQHGTPALAYSFTIKEKLRLDKAKLKKLKIPHGPHMKQLQQGRSIKLEGKTITPKQVAYKEQGRKVAFILDTKMNPNTIKIAKDADILVCEASFTEEIDSKARENHLTAKDAATIAKKAKVKQLILTHLSQRYDYDNKPIENEAKKIFKNTKITKDLDEIEL